jgi:hypothetical protein
VKASLSGSDVADEGRKNRFVQVIKQLERQHSQQLYQRVAVDVSHPIA